MIEFEKITEAQAGLPVGTVDRYIKALRRNGVNLHSLMLFKDGKCLCEAYAPGFDADFRHRLYSVSKTYVSAAVGIAAGEHRLRLSDRIADYFTDKTGGNPEPYLRDLTVRDCLTMQTPFDETPYNNMHDDWVKDFFTENCTHRGGSIFHYDTGASLVLDELVRRVTGLPFNEYLYEKCLKHIGCERCPECVEAPDGVKWGGSGMLCTAREFAAFARLWMNGGRADDGAQLIPAEYIAAAVSKQTGNAEDNVHNNLRGYGYGYQTWMIKHGWAMFGMGNQLALCFPGCSFMLVCTGDDQGNVFARNYLLDLLLEMFVEPLLGKKAEDGETGLGSPLPRGESASVLEKLFSGKQYAMKENRAGIEKICFTFSDGECVMKFTARGEEKTVKAGMGHFTEGVFPEKYSGIRINTPMDRGYRCFAAAAWDLPDLLVLRLYAADMYFGVLTLNVRFSENGIDLHFTKTAEWFFDEYTGFATGDSV